MPLSTRSSRPFLWNESGYNQLTRGRLSPVGRDIDRRALRVVKRMKQNVTGRPGPRIQTRNLYEAISYLRFGEDPKGMFADIGPQEHRMSRRGWNYALILERGRPGAPAYPFLAKSLDAAKD